MCNFGGGGGGGGSFRLLFANDANFTNSIKMPGFTQSNAIIYIKCRSPPHISCALFCMANEWKNKRNNAPDVNKKMQ